MTSPNSYQTIAWRNCQSHRQKVTATLQWLAADKQPTLCVWGAGPCNDLDLPTLLQCYSRLTLVDLDGETLRNAVTRRSLASTSRLQVLGDLDLAGTASVLDASGIQANRSTSQTEAMIQAAHQFKPVGLGSFDVVVSTCLLSQILEPVVERYSDQPELLVELLTVIRRRHLELMVEHTSPGGHSLLVTDVTSSDALPELASPDANPGNLLRHQVLSGNFFHGMNPRAISQEIEQNEFLRNRVQRHLVSEPWIWDATDRKYLCLSFLMYTN